MKAVIMACPILLGACASPWPSGSYVAVNQDDAVVMVPIIANYLAGAIPSGSAITIEPAKSGDLIASMLAADLDREGIPRSADGHRVQYIVEPMDGGVFLRVSIDDREGGNRYFSRANGTLNPAGPMMVALP